MLLFAHDIGYRYDLICLGITYLGNELAIVILSVVMAVLGRAF